MNVDSIKNGIVIDHITAGKAMEIYNMLSLDKLDCAVKKADDARTDAGKAKGSADEKRKGADAEISLLLGDVPHDKAKCIFEERIAEADKLAEKLDSEIKLLQKKIKSYSK